MFSADTPSFFSYGIKMYCNTYEIVNTYWFPDCIGQCMLYSDCWEKDPQDPEDA